MAWLKRSQLDFFTDFKARFGLKSRNLGKIGKKLFLKTIIAIIFENFYCFERNFCSPQVFEKLIISSRIIVDIHVRHSFRDLRLRSLGT